MTLLIFGMFVVLGSGVFAVYVFSITGTSSYVIDSGVGITFSDNFVIDELVDAGNSDITSIKVINITNGNGLINATFDLNSTIIDGIDGCNNTNDVLISGNYNGTALNDSDTILIINGQSTLEITTFVRQFACNQTASYDVVIATQ